MRIRWMVWFVVLCGMGPIGISGFGPLYAQDKDEFARRREVLLAKWPDAVIVLRNRSRGDEALDKNFYYMTGCEEPGAACILNPGSASPFGLFVRTGDFRTFFYEGWSFDPEAVRARFHADTVGSIRDFSKILRSKVVAKKRVVLDFGDEELVSMVLPWVDRMNEGGFRALLDFQAEISELRLFKDSGEIDMIRRSTEITNQSLLETMRILKPGMTEARIKAEIEYGFRKGGASGPGFPSIVCAGRNATILHYAGDSGNAEAGDLILMDVGAGFGHYMADVTRTVPASGKFSPRQAEIYAAVLEAHQRGLELLVPGQGMHQAHNLVLEIVSEALFRMGLITDTKALWQTKVYLPYDVSHWLGLDVHDVGRFGREDGKGRPLKPGMVVTLEPGLYIREETLDRLSEFLAGKVPVDEVKAFVDRVRPEVRKYDGIGVRIEDTLVIEENGHENLSGTLPIRIEEIEKLMSARSRTRQD